MVKPPEPNLHTINTQLRIIEKTGIWHMPLGNFIRSVIGLDIEVVNRLFADYISKENLRPEQITFIKTLINYLNVNGTLDKSLLVKPPFNEAHNAGIMGVFDDESDVRHIISIIDTVNDNAG